MLGIVLSRYILYAHNINNYELRKPLVFLNLPEVEIKRQCYIITPVGT